jgi:hypothetical protein
MFKRVMFIAMSLCSVAAHASNWKVLDSGNNAMVNFVDAETIDKKGDNITIWWKQIYDEGSVLSDGSYSMAERVVVNCKNKTLQVLMWTDYDKSQKYMSSSSTPGKVAETIPDSVGQGVLKEVCNKNFPSNLSSVKDNDIYGFSALYFDNLKNPQKYDPAPK